MKTNIGCMAKGEFNRLEFEAVKSESGRNAFSLSPQKWIRKTGAIGITTKAVRYNRGTYTHSHALWISLYVYNQATFYV